MQQLADAPQCLTAPCILPVCTETVPIPVREDKYSLVSAFSEHDQKLLHFSNSMCFRKIFKVGSEL